MKNKFVPVVENLEKREVPAGNVNIVFSGNNLILTGDFNDNNIDLTFSGNVVNVAGAGTTFIGNSPGGFFVGGTVLVYGNGGGDNVTLSGNATLAGDLNLQLGDGNNTVNQLGGSVSCRDFFVNNTYGDDQVAVSNLSSRTVSVVNGDGSSNTNLTGITATGALTVRNGVGSSQIAKVGSLSSAVSVAGITTLASGNGATYYDSELVNFSAGNAVYVTNGSGTGNAFIVIDKMSNSGVNGGNVVATNGSNVNNSIFLNGVNNSYSVQVTNGLANNYSTNANYVVVQNVTGQNVTVTNYAASALNYADIDNVTSTGSFVVNTHVAPTKSISVDGLNAWRATVNSYGAGFESINIGTAAAVNATGFLNVTGGDGNSAINIGEGQLAQLNVYDTYGDDVVTVGSANGAGLKVTGTSAFQLTAGNDTLDMGSSGRKVSFDKRITTYLGAGDDWLIIGANTSGPALLALDFAFSGDTGTDKWTISQTAIPGISPLMPNVANKLYSFEGVNTVTP